MLSSGGFISRSNPNLLSCRISNPTDINNRILVTLVYNPTADDRLAGCFLIPLSCFFPHLVDPRRLYLIAGPALVGLNGDSFHLQKAAKYGGKVQRFVKFGNIMIFYMTNKSSGPS